MDHQILKQNLSASTELFSLKLKSVGAYVLGLRKVGTSSSDFLIGLFARRPRPAHFESIRFQSNDFSGISKVD